MNDLIDAQVEKFKKDFMEGNFKKTLWREILKKIFPQITENNITMN